MLGRAVVAALASAPPLGSSADDTDPLVLVGLGVVAVGTALVLTARRRRAQRLSI